MLVLLIWAFQHKNDSEEGLAFESGLKWPIEKLQF